MASVPRESMELFGKITTLVIKKARREFQFAARLIAVSFLAAWSITRFPFCPFSYAFV